MPPPLLPAPGAKQLARRLSVRPGVRRRLRDIPAPPVDAGATAEARRRVAQLLSEHRVTRRAAVPGRAARLDRWQVRRADLARRIAQVIAARPRRTPEQVLLDLLAVVRRHPAASGARAGVIVRSPLADATAASLLGAGPAIRALTIAGLRVAPLRRVGGLYRYEVVLPVLARDLGNEIENVAWAIRSRSSVVAARPDRHALRLFAGETARAVVAPARISWHVDMVRADRAHTLSPGSPGGRRRGGGAVIAHPDTGWAPHPQYRRGGIDRARGHDTATGRTGPAAARHGVVHRDTHSNLTHGTATGCLMIGGDGTGPDTTHLTDLERAIVPPVVHPVTESGRIVGIAPAATVVPIKFIPDDVVDIDGDGDVAGTGVVRISDGDFEKAVGYARRIGADVMSLSVGGTLSDDVCTAIEDAVRDSDMIVVAAAGQTYLANVVSVLDPDDSVIEPARFADVIAVAGCSTNGRPWAESHRGPNVDITAPADAVWVADFAGEVPRPVLKAASGTSFATAIVAGAAAAWVAHWGGRAKLKETYENTPLAWAFREVLQRSARTVDGSAWDTTRFGPGVLDVERLLRTPLPAERDVPAPPATRANLLDGVEVGLGVLDDVVDFVGDQAEAAAAATLVLAGMLDRVVDDLAEDLARARAALDDATGAAADTLRETVAAGERLLTDAVDAAEDMAEEAAEQGEEIVDALVDGVEKAAAATGEAIDAVVDWFRG